MQLEGYIIPQWTCSTNSTFLIYNTEICSQELKVNELKKIFLYHTSADQC